MLYKIHAAGRSTAAVHMEVLQKYAPRWVELKCRKTCFVCMRRTPQYGIECGHCICENCVKVFGRASENDPWYFAADFCFLCRADSKAKFRIHPPMAGVGVLCIDGGGIRGIIPTTILELLEERIGLPIPIQQHFKLALGISAGKFSGGAQRLLSNL